MFHRGNAGVAHARFTWRAQGIPVDFDHGKLKDAILGAYFVDVNDKDVSIQTLALDVRRPSQQATIRFVRTPPQLESAVRGSGRSQIVLNIPKSQARDNDIGHQQVHRITLDTHFMGQTVLYDPRSAKPVVEHEADILAVSGLGSHAYGSFVNKSDGNMWLADTLPYYHPTARIILWGFESQLQDSTSFAQLGDLAHNLRLIIRRILNSHPKRPLVLIGHSLGGLLIKEALCSLVEDEVRNIQLVSRVKILFFGVPNYGMDIGTLRAMVSDQPNRGLLESLGGPNSPTLQKLRRRFDRTLEQAPIILFCFYETEESPTAIEDPKTGRYSMSGPRRCLVTVESAKACLPSAQYDTRGIAIFRNHSELVKFSYHDSEYSEKVDYALEQLLSEDLASVSREQDAQEDEAIMPGNRDSDVIESKQSPTTTRLQTIRPKMLEVGNPRLRPPSVPYWARVEERAHDPPPPIALEPLPQTRSSFKAARVNQTAQQAAVHADQKQALLRCKSAEMALASEKERAGKLIKQWEAAHSNQANELASLKASEARLLQRHHEDSKKLESYEEELLSLQTTSRDLRGELDIAKTKSEELEAAATTAQKAYEARLARSEDDVREMVRHWQTHCDSLAAEHNDCEAKLTDAYAKIKQLGIDIGRMAEGRDTDLKRLNDHKAWHEREMIRSKDEHTAELADLQARHEHDLSSLLADHLNELDSLRARHARGVIPVDMETGPKEIVTETEEETERPVHTPIQQMERKDSEMAGQSVALQGAEAAWRPQSAANVTGPAWAAAASATQPPRPAAQNHTALEAKDNRMPGPAWATAASATQPPRPAAQNHTAFEAKDNRMPECSESANTMWKKSNKLKALLVGRRKLRTNTAQEGTTRSVPLDPQLLAPLPLDACWEVQDRTMGCDDSVTPATCWDVAPILPTTAPVAMEDTQNAPRFQA